MAETNDILILIQDAEHQYTRNIEYVSLILTVSLVVYLCLKE